MVKVVIIPEEVKIMNWEGGVGKNCEARKYLAWHIIGDKFHYQNLIFGFPLER